MRSVALVVLISAALGVLLAKSPVLVVLALIGVAIFRMRRHD